MLTFGDSNTSYKLDGDLLGTMTNFDFNVSHSNPQNQKLFYEFEKEMKIYIKQKGRRKTEICFLKNYLNHQFSWFLEFQQNFYHLILLNFVIE